MRILVCKRCSHRFAFGLSSCPMCTGESAYLVEETEGDKMGKSTIHGTTVEGGDGVTRAVDADGSIGDPIHEVTTDLDVNEVPVDESVIAEVPADVPVEVEQPAAKAPRGRNK